MQVYMFVWVLFSLNLHVQGSLIMFLIATTKKCLVLVASPAQEFIKRDIYLYFWVETNLHSKSKIVHYFFPFIPAIYVKIKLKKTRFLKFQVSFIRIKELNEDKNED